MKKLIAPALTLIMLLAVASPALAQEGTPKSEQKDDVPPGPPPGEETATLSFELAVEGNPPANATFFGNVQTGEGGPGTFVPLTDPDGDGVYTGATTTPRFGPGPRPVPPGVEPLSFGVQIVQGTGTQGSIPGAPITVIRDFGVVPMNDQTFSASASFPDDGGGSDPDDTVEVTFELVIDGEVPEGQFLDAVLVSGDIAFERVEFCSTSDVVGTDLPSCESGETYSGTVEVPAGSAFDFYYNAAQFDESGGPVSMETFYSDTRRFTEDDTVSATYRPDDDPGNGEDTVTATFELTVEGTPPEDATFFGYLGYEPASFQLTDPDGDGLYTGSTPPTLIPAGDTQPALIVQGTGTRESQVVGTSPGEPISTIRDFGEVTFEDDTTLRASVSFESDGGSGSGGSGGGFLSNAADSMRGLLPSTGGGAALAVLGVGVVLILGGLAVRRIFR